MSMVVGREDLLEPVLELEKVDNEPDSIELTRRDGSLHTEVVTV
jgi:hypothetical protein